MSCRFVVGQLVVDLLYTKNRSRLVEFGLHRHTRRTSSSHSSVFIGLRRFVLVGVCSCVDVLTTLFILLLFCLIVAYRTS